ncbi:MAG: DNA translocase FtsK 4TM domain-containing protein [Alphaproteobacteria bacterium]|nr:DNA translocase FtsK 4TM domain-containing protein [Alphaproteobacteria bacterium]
MLVLQSDRLMTTRLLPPGLKNLLKKSLSQIIGLVLIVSVILCVLAVVGYAPSDPSLNTATSAITQNWLGAIGAITADLFLQIFGLSSFLLFLIVGMWGIQLSQYQGTSLGFSRILGAVLATVLLGTFLMILPLSQNSNHFIQMALVKMTPGASQLPCMGGVFGYLLLSVGQRFLTHFHALALIKPLAFVLFSLSMLMSLYATGLSIRQITYGGICVYKGFGWLLAFMGRIFSRGYSLSHRHENPLEKQSPSLSSLMKDAAPTSSPLSNSEMFTNADQEDEEDEKTPPEIKVHKKHEKKDRFTTEIINSVLLEGGYHLPPVELLDQASQKVVKVVSQEALEEFAKQLEIVLEEFGVRGEIVNIRPGPVVTMYELKPAAGIKTSRVIGLADDIARSMSALSARIAVIPGQNVIGIELPNPSRQTVYLKELLTTSDYQASKANLPLILGKDIGGQPIIIDLAKTPHLLVAGTTGSGKSVSINTMILSLLFKLSPEQCKFIMIDPKMLELSVYDEIPHLLSPVVTDPKKAVVALKWAVREMENRYRAMAKLGVRNIDGFNARLEEAKGNGEILVRRVQTGFDPDSGKPIFENQTFDFTPLPYIVVVVDEMADLMLVAGKEIEGTVQRLAQMARAAGIHLIMATQRPSVDVITGTIKANFPTRISFQVTSKIDSRTILGEQGAEQLLGQGDMLYMAGGGRITRVHGPYIRDDEVERIVKFLKAQGEPSYVDGVTEDDEQGDSGGDPVADKGGDDLYRQAIDLITREGKVSTSFIQRHLQIGYNRAARIVDQMEKEGVVSAANHVGKREILR